jgi:hypothetical protein
MPPAATAAVEDEQALETDVNAATSDEQSEEVDPPQNDGDVDDEFGGATDEEVAFAKANGWSGRERWRGAADKFETAKDFAERSKGINTLLQRELSRRDATRNEEIAQMRADMQRFNEMDAKRRQTEFDTRLADIRARRVQALNENDGAAVDAAERELEGLGARPDVPKPPKPAAPTLSATDQAASTDFAARNPWVNDDRSPKARLALVVGQGIIRDRPELKGNVSGFLGALETKLQEDYPDMFGQRGNGMRNARTEAGNPPRRGNDTQRARGFKDMPKDAQDACDRLVKTKFIKTREDYVKNYFESEA